MTKTYRISEVATLTGLSIPTLRYYETLGLLKPVHQVNNYRMFTDKELSWINFIKRAKATGMPLAKIMTYAKLREQGHETIKQRIAILEQQEQILHSEQAKIQEHIDFLQKKKQYYAQLTAKYETQQ